MEISQNFVAFTEDMNFNMYMISNSYIWSRVFKVNVFQAKYAEGFPLGTYLEVDFEKFITILCIESSIF